MSGSARPQRRVRSPAERSAGYRKVVQARNPATPAAELRVLATDDFRPVRLWVARHPATPADVLHLLACDRDSSVRWNALLHPEAPVAALRVAAEAEAHRYGDRAFIERELVAHHPNADLTLRQAMLAAGTCRNPAICPQQDAFALRSRRNRE